MSIIYFSKYGSVAELWGDGLGWISPELATGVEDDQGASCEGENVWTKYIRLTNFGFTIPSGCKVSSITVGARIRCTEMSMPGMEGFLQKSGGNYCEDFGLSYRFGVGWEWFGMSPDAGKSPCILALTHEEINSPNFGFNFRAYLPVGYTSKIELDAVNIWIALESGATDYLPLVGMGP